MLRTLAGAAILTVVAASAALGGQSPSGDFDLALTTKRPAVPTGLKLHVVLKDPDDPDAKPSPITGGEIRFPKGMRVDTGAVPRCDASDDEFQAAGRDACPKDTVMGTGTLVVMFGLPGDPQELDLVAFNAESELTEVVFFKDTNVVAAIDRVKVRDGRLEPHPPLRPGGPPDGYAAVRELRLELPKRVGPGGRAYATSPRKCRTGRWRTRARFEFNDGSTASVSDDMPCRRPRPRGRGRSA